MPDVRLEVKRHLVDEEIAQVTELLDVAAAHDGHRPLGDHAWLDLARGGREGFAALVAWEPGHDHPVGYAQVARGREDGSNWALELVVTPHHRTDEPGIGADLVRSALGIVADEGGGHVHLWLPKPTAATDELAAQAGMRRGRDLYQMRRPLPMDAPFSVTTRAFVPGADEEAWLEVNNRAFHWHPEQGDWTMDVLRAREAEPWFDPKGFLLHERDGRLAAFCWTKVHDDHDPPLGEIYVIAVDPDFQGLGLGRTLALAGLDSLASRGLEVGMLYVDATNTPALRLYEDMGFTVDHVDRAYVADIRPR